MDQYETVTTSFSTNELWALHTCMRKEGGEEISKDMMVDIWTALLESFGNNDSGNIEISQDMCWMITRKISFSLSIGSSPVGMTILKKVIPLIINWGGCDELGDKDKLTKMLEGVEIGDSPC